MELFSQKVKNSLTDNKIEYLLLFKVYFYVHIIKLPKLLIQKKKKYVTNYIFYHN